MDSSETDYVPQPIVYALHNFTKKFQLIYPNKNSRNSRRPECVGIKRNPSIIPKLRFLKKYFANQIKLRKIDNCWTCCKNSFDQLLPKSIIDGLQPQQLYPFIKVPRPTMSPKKGRCNQNGSVGESSPKIRPTPTDDEDDNDFVEILSISKPVKSYEEIVIDSDSDTGTVSNTTRITSHSLISTESKKSASSSVEDEVEVVFSTNVPTSKSVSELETPMPPPTTSLPKPVHPLGNDIVSTPERPLENGDTETVLLISESKKSASSSVEDDEVEVIFSKNVSTSKSVPELRTSMPPPTTSPPKSVRPVGNDINSALERPIQKDIVLPPSPTILITSDPVVDSDSVVDSELETVIRTPKRKRVVVSSSSSESSSDESSAPPFASTKLSDSAVIRLKNCRVGIERLPPSCTRRILPKRACRCLHFQHDKELFSKLDEIDKLISQPVWNSSDSDSDFEPAPNTSFPVSDTGSESDSDNLQDSDSGPNVSDCSNEESESGPNVDCFDEESDSGQNVSDCSNEESEFGPHVSERSDDESEAEEDEQERTRRDLLTTQMSRPIVVVQTVAEKQQLIEEREQNENRKIRQRGARTEYMESYLGHLPFVPVTLEVAMDTLTKNLGWDVFPFGAKLLGKSPTKDDLGAMNRSEKAVQWETLKIDFVVKHFQEVLRLKKDENDEWICCQNALNFLDCKAFLKLFWNLSA